MYNPFEDLIFGFFLKDDDDDDNEISCTPALAPSRLAQNVPGYLPPPTVGDEHNKLDSASTQDSPMEENSESDMADGEDEKDFKEAVERCHNVDPKLSRSFLNFLYDVEVQETSEAEVKVHVLPVNLLFISKIDRLIC